MYKQMLYRIGLHADIYENLIIRSKKYDNIEMIVMSMDIKNQIIYKDACKIVENPHLLKLLYNIS